MGGKCGFGLNLGDDINEFWAARHKLEILGGGEMGVWGWEGRERRERRERERGREREREEKEKRRNKK